MTLDELEDLEVAAIAAYRTDKTQKMFFDTLGMSSEEFVKTYISLATAVLESFICSAEQKLQIEIMFHSLPTEWQAEIMESALYNEILDNFIWMNEIPSHGI